MNSVYVNLIVEGTTEQTFVREILAPYLAQNNIYLRASNIGTVGKKGGDVRYSRLLTDIRKLMHIPNTYISTMLDFYGIDPNWPGMAALNEKRNTGLSLSVEQKACIIEQATIEQLTKDLPDHNVEKRVIPYIAMHEHEALLFSDPASLASALKVNPMRLTEDLQPFATPEDINDQPNTAPSKRIKAYHKRFSKTAMGIPIAQSIGIPAMRSTCSHFNRWIERLEQLDTTL